MLWLINHFLLQIGLLGTGAFLDLYLWENTRDLQTILLYNLGIFLALPIFTLVLAWLTELIDLRLGQMLVLLLGVGFSIILIFASAFLLHQPLLLGLIRGVVLGGFLLTINVYSAKIAAGARPEASISRFVAVETIAGIILPPALALSAYYFASSFQLLFWLSLVAFSISLVLSSIQIFPTVDHKFNLVAAILPLNRTNPEKSILARALFALGVKDGFFFSLLGVIILHFTGDLRGWGIFAFVLALASLVFDLTYSRFFKKIQPFLISGLGTIIFTMLAVIFVANFNLTGLIIFALGHAALEATFGISLMAALAQIISLDTAAEDLTVEYAVFSQVYKNLGRFLPVAALIWLNASLDSPAMLLGVIVAISLVPFSIIGIVSQSFALRHPSTYQFKLKEA